MIRKQQIRTCHVRDCIVLLDVTSEIEEYRATTYQSKEPETLEWIERYFRPGDVMYDIGANIGLYSLFAAKHIGEKGKVYAFEPEATNFAQLNRNVMLNSLSRVIVPCCVAVTDRPCFDVFYLNPHGFETMTADRSLVPGSALHSFGVAEDYRGRPFDAFHTQGTVGISVDHLWRVWGLDFPNHMKIDVDGLEEKIVVGAAQTLKDRRLKSILIEVSGNDGAEFIFRCLTEAGFIEVEEFAEHSSRSLKGTPYEGCVNHVFARSF